MVTDHPTTVWKLENTLRDEGFPQAFDFCYTTEALRRQMNNPGLYSELGEWDVGDVSFSVSERRTEPKVELSIYDINADQLPVIAEAIAKHHKSKSPKHKIKLTFICSPTVAVEISKALRDHAIGKE